MVISTAVLAQINYFNGLSHSELEAVKKYIAFEKTIEKGETLLFEGDQSEYMYLVVSGAVKVYKKSANRKEQILNVATSGESLNDVSTFDGGGSAANMLAMTTVRLYAVRKGDMERLVYGNPKIARNVAGVLASRVRRDSSLVEVLSFDQVISRLARLILKQATAVGGDLLPHFTQQDLAAMVGTSRVVVNRSLRVMEEKGAIRLERRRIVITDEEALKALMT
ncbi:MAG: Crp/Fnr family transcriptional regulator [Dehalococcoidales bacterium]|nr:Crp/Fnr family transcriptional regulator [Dehalococcoidales bacterium]